MKKFTILIIIMCGAVGAYAQFEQGRMLVGGTVEFNAVVSKYKSDGTTVTNGRQTSFSLAPQFGYFVIDNLAVGAALDLGLSKYKSEDGDYESTSTSIEFQPMVRYYLPQGIFFQGQFGFGTGKDKVDNGNTDDDKYNITSWGLSAGYAYFLADNVAIEPQLGYGGTGYKDKDSSGKSIVNGLFIRVGLQVYLGK
jgi:hypothetical protein